MPLHTREVLMHMLLWQKNALPAQGAEKQTQVYQYVMQTGWRGQSY